MSLSNLKVMRRPDVALLLTLGILRDRDDEFTAFNLHGLLINDPIIHQRVRALPSDSEFPALRDQKYVRQYNTPYGPTHAVVAEMTATEKAALRDRIIAAREKS